LGFDIGIAALVMVAIAALAFFLLSLRATLIRTRNEAMRALANLDAHIKQRNDLIPTLVETCRGYLEQDQEPLKAVAEARYAFAKAKTSAEKAACELAMRQKLAALFEVVEQHRELRINNNYQKFRARSAEIGREVDSSRQMLNQAVDRYNHLLGAFPGLWVGYWLKMKPQSRYEWPESGAPDGGLKKERAPGEPQSRRPR
jgi:LemA protein